VAHVIASTFIGVCLLAGAELAAAQSTNERAATNLNLREAFGKVDTVDGLPAARSKVHPARRSTPTHRFLDVCNLASTAVAAAALLADGYYTQYGLTQYPDRFVEIDPLARPFVSRGWAGQVVGGALVIGADLGIRYVLHRTNHHRVERWIPAILISYGAIGAIHNAKLIRRVRQ
jgi:hypothetical protein